MQQLEIELEERNNESCRRDERQIMQFLDIDMFSPLNNIYVEELVNSCKKGIVSVRLFDYLMKTKNIDL